MWTLYNMVSALIAPSVCLIPFACKLLLTFSQCAYVTAFFECVWVKCACNKAERLVQSVVPLGLTFPSWRHQSHGGYNTHTTTTDTHSTVLKHLNSFTVCVTSRRPFLLDNQKRLVAPKCRENVGFTHMFGSKCKVTSLCQSCCILHCSVVHIWAPLWLNWMLEMKSIHLELWKKHWIYTLNNYGCPET